MYSCIFPYISFLFFHTTQWAFHAITIKSERWRIISRLHDTNWTNKLRLYYVSLTVDCKEYCYGTTTPTRLWYWAKLSYTGYASVTQPESSFFIGIKQTELLHKYLQPKYSHNIAYLLLVLLKLDGWAQDPWIWVLGVPTKTTQEHMGTLWEVV